MQKARLRVIFVRALYLPRLFAKRPVTFGKQHNFFTNNQLSHKTRKKIFHFIYQNVLFGLGQFNPNKIKYIESPNLKLAGIPKGRALWQRAEKGGGHRGRETTTALNGGLSLPLTWRKLCLNIVYAKTYSHLRRMTTWRKLRTVKYSHLKM